MKIGLLIFYMSILVAKVYSINYSHSRSRIPALNIVPYIDYTRPYQDRGSF